MRKINVRQGIALIGVGILLAMTAVAVLQATTSTSAGKNMGWFRYAYSDFRPQFQTVVSASTAANTAIYCPGIKSGDKIFLCVSLDSLTTNRTTFVNLTDSTYIQDNDTIGIGTATGLGADLIVGWHKSNW